MPCGYTGFILESAPGQAQAAAPEVQPAQRETGRFHSLTYWNHDTDPVSTDSVRRAVAWLPLAAQVRGYITLVLEVHDSWVHASMY